MGAIAVADAIFVALGLLPTALSALKTMLSDVAALFGDLGQDKAQAVAQQAADITGQVEADTETVNTWFNTTVPDMTTLLQIWPAFPKLLFSAYQIKSDQGVDLHTAITAAQLGANSVKQASLKQ